MDDLNFSDHEKGRGIELPSDLAMAQLYSPHAEESLIGAAIINPKVIDLVDVSEDDFYIRRHGIIWAAIHAIRRRGADCDFVTLGDELSRQGRLEEIGGPAALARLVSETPSSLGAEDYAAIVKNRAARRRTVLIARELARIAYDSKADLETGIAGQMTALARTTTSGLGAIHWSEYLREAYDFVEERAKNPGDIWGIRTGFSSFDYLTGGLQLSELMLVSGEPGAGKSIFVMQLAEQLASGGGGASGEPGAVYSLEMSGRAVAIRSISAKSQIKTRLMKSGKMADDDWPIYCHQVERLEKLQIYMSDDSRWTTHALRADLARLKVQKGIRWFIVDYGYLLQDGMGAMSETERTQYISAQLKGICKSLNLSGIVIHSMNKAGMQAATAGQSSLRGSAQVQYDADVILFLTVPDKKRPNLVRCEFGKGREVDTPSRFFDLERGLEGVPVYQEVSVHTRSLNHQEDDSDED